MAYHLTRFPDSISYGSRGGPGYRTSVVELDSGAEERVAHWSAPRYRYDVSFGVTSFPLAKELQTFYIAVKGPAASFPYKDFADYSSSAAATPSASTPDDEDVVIGTGDGDETEFQLRKVYTSGAVDIIRPITKPVTGTTVIAIDGVAQASGWTVDTTTGIVTFTVAPGVGEEITAGFEFDVPVRFGSELDPGLFFSIDGFEAGTFPPVPLVEVIGEAECDEEFSYGGAVAKIINASGSFTSLTGRLQVLNVTVASLTYKAPAVADMPLGGPHFLLQNTGAEDLDLIDENDDPIDTLPSGEFRQLWLADAGGGAKSWASF